jgi:hypothetical protein
MFYARKDLAELAGAASSSERLAMQLDRATGKKSKLDNSAMDHWSALHCSNSLTAP